MIDLGQVYQTRDGRPVRIFMTDAGGAKPILGAIQTKPGRWVTRAWTPDGFYWAPPSYAQQAHSNEDIVLASASDADPEPPTEPGDEA